MADPDLASIARLLDRVQAELRSTRQEMRLVRDEIRLVREEVRLLGEEVRLLGEEVRINRDRVGRLEDMTTDVLDRIRRLEESNGSNPTVDGDAHGFSASDVG
jgi:cell division protein ZapA (FtsZ GTPase activity inhibitor)